MNAIEEIEYIEHDGIVTEVNAAAGTVTVRIDERDECGSCPAANLCSGGRDTSGLVTVATRRAADFRKGEEVVVRGSERMHRRAIMLATVIPCVALVAVMVAVYLLTGNQLAAALGGLATMIVFFILLYACRNRIAHEFTFEILKL